MNQKKALKLDGTLVRIKLLNAIPIGPTCKRRVKSELLTNLSACVLKYIVLGEA